LGRVQSQASRLAGHYLGNRRSARLLRLLNKTTSLAGAGFQLTGALFFVSHTSWWLK
jgi:hypothetical protein